MEWITRVMQASGRWDEDQEFRTNAQVKSPLCLRGRDAEILYYQAKRGWLTHVGSSTITGATSPCTLAGDMVLRFAETFGFLTFSRLVTPSPDNVLKSTPSASFPIEMDLQKGNLILASPRERLCRIGFAQMQGEFYKVAGSRAGMDFMADAAEPGIQACTEKALSAMATLPTGVYTNAVAREKQLGATTAPAGRGRGPGGRGGGLRAARASRRARRCPCSEARP